MLPAFAYRSESDDSPPTELREVDDLLRADDAIRLARQGKTLWYRGTFLNAKQLLSAMARRIPGVVSSAKSPLERFRQERRARHDEHQILSKLVVSLDESYRLQLKGAPDVRAACEHVWGAAPDLTIVPLKTLLGMMGAEAWRQKGLRVPGLTGTLVPFYGVYLPTRAEYVELLARVAGIQNAQVFDVGAGTGVLSFVLLQRGAASVTATDVEPRAVECARFNAARLNLADRFFIEQRALFPDGTADLIVCNPPWIPESPKNRFDGAVFDEGGQFLEAFLAGASAHLATGGRVLLILSDLAELIGLRPPGWLAERFQVAGLRVKATHSTRPRHAKTQKRDDPLHDVRSREVTSLYELTRVDAGPSPRLPSSRQTL